MLFTDLTYYASCLGAVRVREDVLALKWDGACTDRAYLNKACLNKAYLDGAYIDGACTDGACVDGAYCGAYYGA